MNTPINRLVPQQMGNLQSQRSFAFQELSFRKLKVRISFDGSHCSGRDTQKVRPENTPHLTDVLTCWVRWSTVFYAKLSLRFIKHYVAHVYGALALKPSTLLTYTSPHYIQLCITNTTRKRPYKDDVK
jgi:hypothetical protein